MNLPLSVFMYPVRLHWIKLTFPLLMVVKCRQLLGCGWKFSQSWDSIGIGVMQILFMPSHVSPNMHQTCFVWNILFPECPLSSLTFKIFLAPLLHSSLSSEGSSLMKVLFLELSLQKFLSLYTFSSC